MADSDHTEVLDLELSLEASSFCQKTTGHTP